LYNFFLYTCGVGGSLSVKKQIDPRIRILLVSLFSVTVFIVDQLLVIIGLTLSFAVIRMAFKVPFRSIKTFLTLSMLVTFIVLLQTLFGPGENYILKPLFSESLPLLGGMGSLKRDGFILGLVISSRLAALMILLPLLTAVSPSQIALGLTGLGFNYRAAFIITSAFNFIPLFEDEGRAIMDAQKLRGARAFDNVSFFVKLKTYPGLVVPLVLGAMRKAKAAGTSMDSRAFGVYKTRTWMDKQPLGVKDYLSLVIYLLFVILTLWLNFALKQG
jgi:energy-coupling factor transport system permease protein